MSAASQDWDGHEWQEYCTQLLYLHHDGQYQPIPDQDRGDGGLEGFSIDGKGCGYQCHAPKSTYGIAERRDRQLTKIKRTVRDLIDKRDVLAASVGTHTIRELRFLFPVCESRKLVEELRVQEQKLREAVVAHNIEWLEPEVIISAHQGGELLAKEVAELARTGAAHARLPLVEVEREAVDGHLMAAAEELKGAAEKLTSRFGPDLAPELLRIVVNDHLAGKQLTAHLQETNPTIFEEYARLVAQRRERVRRESLQGDTADRTLVQISDELSAAIVASVPGVHHDDAHKLAESAVADWLIDCPLRFSVSTVTA